MARVPYPIFLVLGGLALGFVPGLPPFEIAPEAIFLIFLPPLLNAAAFAFSPRDLRDNLRPITLLAVGLVLATMFAVAFLAHAVIGLPWAAAFVLGAILAPTDPVAAEAIFSRLGVPKRVSAVVGGESLLNDGTGLVAYRVAVVAVVTGVFSAWDATLSFLVVSGGGIAVGLILALTVLPLWARLRDPAVLVLVSLLLPYGVYIVAEEVLHVSGILAVVVFGLIQGWRAPLLFSEASTRLQALSFWSVTTFTLEALLFVLIGQQFPAVVRNLSDETVGQLLLYATLVFLAVTGVRMVWFFSLPYLHPIFDRLLRSHYLRASWQERLVMGWSGMRGGVSLAAALAIPLTVRDGSPFPNRDLILFLTLAVILATLVLQGLTLSPLIRALRLKPDEDGNTVAELKARLKAAHAALAKLEALCEGYDISPATQERMREYYEERIRRYTSGLEAGRRTEEYDQGSSAWREWRRSLISAERETILDLRNRGELSPETMRRIERDLDLEESRISG
jgi:CPA1 family monovalent cation:H+ antiporter